MKFLATLLISSIFLPVLASAQYAAFKSDDGILLISQKPGQYFSVDLPGKTIIPVGQQQTSHPSFIIRDRADTPPIEGRFVQVMPVPMAEFKGSPNDNDEALLRKQAAYEINYWKPNRRDLRATKLDDGRAALLWALTLPKKAPNTSMQMFLSFRQDSYVLVLSSNVIDNRGQKPVETYLRTVARSFRAAAKPIPTPTPPKPR